MGNITSTDVLNLAPELTGTADARMTWAVAEANTRLKASYWTDTTMDPSRQTMGRALYAAHILSVKPGGQVSSETVGPLTRSYAVKATTDDADELDTTIYGRRYRRLVRNSPGRLPRVY